MSVYSVLKVLNPCFHMLHFTNNSYEMEWHDVGFEDEEPKGLHTSSIVVALKGQTVEENLEPDIFYLLVSYIIYMWYPKTF